LSFIAGNEERRGCFALAIDVAIEFDDEKCFDGREVLAFINSHAIEIEPAEIFRGLKMFDSLPREVELREVALGQCGGVKFFEPGGGIDRGNGGTGANIAKAAFPIGAVGHARCIASHKSAYFDRESVADQMRMQLIVKRNG